MAIAVDWNDDNLNIIRLIFDREWTWDDLGAALTKCSAMRQEIGQPVGLLLIIPVQVRLPSMFLSNIAPYLSGDYNVGAFAVAVVTPDLLSEVMMRAIFRVYGADQANYTIFMANTPNDGRVLIQKRAEELGL